MKKLLDEPLLHFLLIGAAIFAMFFVVRGSDDARPNEEQIVVSAGKVEHLAALFARTWQRPPTRAELEALIEDFIREEAAYREGMAMGLDRDDTIIRRRIRQKLDFVAEDLAAQIEPTDEDLKAHLAAHADAFRVEPRLSFRQVYFDPQSRGEALADDIAEVIGVLSGDPSIDAAALGDRILLEHAYASVSQRDVANLLGAEFAEAIAELEVGAWHGPIRSGYGAHAVIVDEKREGRLPELDEVRDAVLREWENERRLEMIDAFYKALVEKYEVIVEWPGADADGQAAEP